VWDVFDLSILPWSKAQHNLNIWFMDNILKESMEKRVLKGSRDDVLRTVELLGLCQRKPKRDSRAQPQAKEAITVEQ